MFLGIVRLKFPFSSVFVPDVLCRMVILQKASGCFVSASLTVPVMARLMLSAAVTFGFVVCPNANVCSITKSKTVMTFGIGTDRLASILSGDSNEKNRAPTNFSNSFFNRPLFQGRSPIFFSSPTSITFPSRPIAIRQCFQKGNDVGFFLRSKVQISGFDSINC